MTDIAKKRSKPNAHRAGYLARWINEEIKRGGDAEIFAIMAHRKTWLLIRTALRSYAK